MMIYAVHGADHHISLFEQCRERLALCVPLRLASINKEISAESFYCAALFRIERHTPIDTQNASS